MLKILLLKFLVFSVMSRSFAADDYDEILDPDELLDMTLNLTSSDSVWFQWDDWDTWEASEEIKSSCTYLRSGYDEDGSVIYITNIGKCKYREVVQEPEKMEEFLKFHEQLIRRAETDGAKDNNKGLVFIIDFDGFSLRNFASAKALKMALKVFISLYRLDPVTKYGFIINVNYAAESFLNLAKPFVGNFLDKFEIYGTRSEKWKPKLIRKLPPSQLPPELGGSKSWNQLPFQVTTS